MENFIMILKNNLAISRFIVILILCSGLAGFNSCNRGKKNHNIKLAHGLDVTHPVHKAMVFMARRVDELSEGKLEVQIYPNQQLGTERQCVELLQVGSIDMTKVSAAVMEGFSPVFKVLSLPYIFRDLDHAHKIYDGEIGKEILLKSEKAWLRGLCFYDAGARSFYSKEKPILTPDDLNGLKIRVMSSNTAVNMIKALGGSPTPISWGELYTALQGGVVDAAENNPPSFNISHHYEICKYYSLDEHTYIPDVLLISTRVWRKLNAEEKDWLQTAVNESVLYQRKIWKESEKEAFEIFKESGVEIFYPDKKLFSEKVKPMYDNYKNDKEVFEFITRIREVK
ncbi:TRAP transporter substrate-binding protein [Bacteroidota bacterium]